MEEKQKTHWSERRLTRWVANFTALLAILALAFVAWQRVIAKPRTIDIFTNNEPLPTEIPTFVPVEKEIDQSVRLAILDLPDTYVEINDQGISRALEITTIIPSRPRVDVITYTVKRGDTLFGIADGYGIKPETLLWGNFETLKDNPHLLSTDQVLNILPVDGVYYQWHEGDSVEKVAAEFKTDPKGILDYPGNQFDLVQVTEGTASVEPGTWIIVPGGKRPIKDWGPPAISRANPASARFYGEGSCGSIYEGAIGTGTFVWPTAYHVVSGYGYSAIHPAIDLGGSTGDAIFASDSGVIVFAGWSNFGYGYLIVVDHGNGFQTAYAHLSAVAVTCGQSVFQGGYIGAMGSTGNSTGPHLHYEIIYNGAKPNPLDFLP
jgi:murein DD-endopeptidase MepM/ murein hydrolase activator NlpD